MSGVGIKNFFLSCNENQNVVSIAEHIKEHLIALLNTRQGALQHLPDYGLPDIVTLYHDLPASKARLIDGVRECILRYEPRLSKVRVCELNTSSVMFIIGLEIHGCINKKHDVSFVSYLLPNISLDIYVKP